MAGQPHAHPIASPALARLALALWCWFWAPLAVAAGADNPVDLRVLIDVSGSMKHNDPHNLRSPALRLLVGLLPDGASSGVWTFGRYVNMPVALAPVDDAWRAQARRAAAGIHSRGAKTNIEEALKQATADWNGTASAHGRIVLLLTDGVVDVGAGHDDSAASRSRILETLVPELRTAGATVHTVALSVDADQDLLRTLSAETGGWYERVDSAEALNRTFLRLFEQSVPATALPIRENRFRVDGAVSDMTVLVFRTGDGTEPALRPPKSGRWTQAEHPASVQWFRESDYDMVTVPTPRSGEWVIEGTSDPDNRVQIVTNLRLVTSALPAQVLGGEPLRAEARLIAEEGEQVPEALLAVTDFRLQLSRPNELPRVVPLVDTGSAGDARADDHVYSARLDAAGLSGVYDLMIEASSPTFERQQRRRLEVFGAPFEIQLEHMSDGSNSWRLRVSAVPALVRTDSVEIELDFGVEGGATQRLTADEDGLWVHTFTPPEQAPLIAVTATAQRRDDATVQVFAQRGLAPARVLAPAVVPELTPTHAEAQTGVRWSAIVVGVVVANLLLSAVAGALFWYLRRRGGPEPAAADLEADG